MKSPCMELRHYRRISRYFLLPKSSLEMHVVLGDFLGIESETYFVFDGN